MNIKRLKSLFMKYAPIRIVNLYMRFLQWFEENEIAKYFPAIKVHKLPEPPNNGVCSVCEFQLRLHVINEDGWVFFWDCENGCAQYQFNDNIEEYWPFLFNWANAEDMLRIGIILPDFMKSGVSFVNEEK